MEPEHCGQPMMQAYERRSREDRYDVALLVETVEAMYVCRACGAKLVTRLDQPVRS